MKEMNNEESPVRKNYFFLAGDFLHAGKMIRVFLGYKNIAVDLLKICLKYT
jgi:hypothetical protein